MSDIEAVATQFSSEPIKEVKRITDGSINDTYDVFTESGDRFILQGMSSIFSPVVLDNLRAIEPLVQAAGVVIPTCRPTTAGDLFLTNGKRWYRALTYLPGTTIHEGTTITHAKSAGELIGHFHDSLADAAISITPPLPHFHDTAFYIERLQAVAIASNDPKKHETLQPLTETVLVQYEALMRLVPALPTRIIHGDLKISNIRFSETGEALALIDMDTVMESTVLVELGDALRSWSATAGEDNAEQVFDQAVYEAALAGYTRAATKISATELTSVPLGVALMTVELSARFITDAYEESYFAQSKKYSSLYEQNKTKAVNQLKFLEIFLASGALDTKIA